MLQLTDIRELKKKQYLLYIIIMLVLFVVMLVYTVVWCVNYNKKYGFFVKTTATVVEHNSDEGKLYDVLEYYVDGVVVLNTTSYLSRNEIGDKITIYYDSTNPTGFVTKLDSRRIVLPVITTIYGVASAALTIMYFTTYYKKSTIMQSNEKLPDKAENDKNIELERLSEEVKPKANKPGTKKKVSGKTSQTSKTIAKKPKTTNTVTGKSKSTNKSNKNSSNKSKAINKKVLSE